MYVSPYVEIDQSKTSIHFRVSGLDVDGYAVLEEGKTQNVSKTKFTSDQCAAFRSQFVKKPKSLLEMARKVQVVLLTSSPVHAPKIRFAFEQRNPPTYQSATDSYLGNQPSNQKPVFKAMEGNLNRCSFEFDERGKIDCDWLLLESRDSDRDGRFRLTESAPCVKQGLKSLPTGEKRFVALEGRRENGNLTLTAFMVSPVVRPSHDRVEISLFTAVTCRHSYVRAYFVPSTKTLRDDVKFVTSQYDPVMEVRREGERTFYSWEQSQVMLEGVEPNKDYQVINCFLNTLSIYFFRMKHFIKSL